jgi:Zn-dependent protease with chaperone function
LLAICAGERDEIAFLLAHEIAHIVLRHTLDRLIKDAAISLLLRKSSSRGAASAWLNQVGRRELTRAYSPEGEFEADAFAVALLKIAGGESGGAERLLHKLNAEISGHYLASHPGIGQRTANLRSAGVY